MADVGISAKAASFTESVIRDMTRLAIAHGAINLAQGFPDFACPQELKDAAKEAIDADINQYAITWGAQRFREAIAGKFERTYGMAVDPNRQLCVTCGSTEAMIAAMLAIVDPGDEVVVFEPFYENYGPDAILSGASPRYVTLHEPDWTFDEGELAAAFNDRTRGIIVNTPNNPTGKVFTRAELETIGALCEKWGAVAFTDEIYEHMTYEGHEHVPPITLPGMEDRTVTINALSKTYSVTGWRVGWTTASPELTDGIRKVHDFLTVGAAAPHARGGRGRDGLARDVLRAARRRVPGAAGSDARHPGGRRLQDLQAVRRVLHHDRHLGAGVRRRRHRGAPSDQGDRGRLGSRFVVLQQARAGPDEATVLVLQEIGDVARGRRATLARLKDTVTENFLSVTSDTGFSRSCAERGPRRMMPAEHPGQARGGPWLGPSRSPTKRVA